MERHFNCTSIAIPHPVLLLKKKDLVKILECILIHPFWKDLMMEAWTFSEQTCLITAYQMEKNNIRDSWWSSTQTICNTALQEWRTFCIKQQINFIESSLNNGSEFLSKK